LDQRWAVIERKRRLQRHLLQSAQRQRKSNIGGIWMTDGIGQNVTISGSGTLNPKGNTIRAKSGVGILVDNTNAFSLTITAAIQLGGDQTWINNSGNLLTISGAGGVNLTNISLTKDDFTIDGTGDTLITTSVSGQGDFTKTGSGRLTLTGLNTYSDPTTVLGGTLQVGISGTGTTGTAATTAGDGVTAATLAGTGTVGGTINSTNHVIKAAAFLKPGDNGGSSNGGLTFNGNLNLNDNSQTQLKVTGSTTSAGNFGGNAVGSVGYLNYIAAHIPIWKTAPKGDHDWLQINGTLTLGQNGTSGLIQVLDNGYVANAQAGDVFDLIDWASISAGSFDPGTNYRSGGLSGDLSLPDLSSKGLFWDVSQFTTNGILIVDVPEPSRVMLLASGGTIFLLRRRAIYFIPPRRAQGFWR
jgi:autotransporter-associated beta strand protein